MSFSRAALFGKLETRIRRPGPWRGGSRLGSMLGLETEAERYACPARGPTSAKPLRDWKHPHLVPLAQPDTKPSISVHQSPQAARRGNKLTGRKEVACGREPFGCGECHAVTKNVECPHVCCLHTHVAPPHSNNNMGTPPSKWKPAASTHNSAHYHFIPGRVKTHPVRMHKTSLVAGVGRCKAPLAVVIFALLAGHRRTRKDEIRSLMSSRNAQCHRTGSATGNHLSLPWARTGTDERPFAAEAPEAPFLLPQRQ